ncbi:dihydropteroate synthase [Pseudonocardia lutea]|uniref:dihydropteroate synthase n=1 Tax=Pseudonocardia lutea TaxID=2172015 RepID=A0ABW1I6H7_9PSEU
MGILNVTPDSFSDGGRLLDPRRAVARGLRMAAAGADHVDVGGESTRPGADRVPAEEELCRVVPVVGELVRAGVAVSIDTTRATVAETAVMAGATLVNDVSGGLADPAMAAVVADSGVRWVLMHWRAPSRHMDEAADYDDVVTDVRRELLARVEAAIAAGVRPEQLILDPGLGFAKRPAHDLCLLAGLDALLDLGLPVLVGASRKRFLGSVLAGGDGVARPPAERDTATVATTVLAARAGAWGVRVHDVAASVDAVRVVAAVDSHAATAERRLRCTRVMPRVVQDGAP